MSFTAAGSLPGVGALAARGYFVFRTVMPCQLPRSFVVFVILCAVIVLCFYGARIAAVGSCSLFVWFVYFGVRFL